MIRTLNYFLYLNSGETAPAVIAEKLSASNFLLQINSNIKENIPIDLLINNISHEFNHVQAREVKSHLQELSQLLNQHLLITPQLEETKALLMDAFLQMELVEESVELIKHLFKYALEGCLNRF